MSRYFVKSFEEDFSTKTLSGKDKVTYQTLDDIIKTGKIKPNTKSFGQKRRLATTILTENYTKTYRPQGIIFQTEESPEYILPFDLVLLSDAKKIIVHYYRIKENLHIYYNHHLIDGYEKFVFKNISAMIKEFGSPMAAWSGVSRFRKEHGYPSLPKTKYRLVEYNEAVFEKPIKVKPVALFGYRAQAKKLAKKYNLKYFRSAKDFFEKLSD